MGRNRSYQRKEGRDRRDSIITPADGGLQLMTVDAVEVVEISVLVLQIYVNSNENNNYNIGYA